MATATITSKGQVTIPAEVRKRLGLKAGDRVDFVISGDGNVTLRTKKQPFEKLRGILHRPGQKPLSVREMDKGIEQAVRERWERVNRYLKK